MSDVKPQYWVSRDDGLRVPTKWNPAQDTWYKDWVRRAKEYFGPERVYREVMVPVDKVVGGHDVMQGHSRTDMYSRMYSAGDRVPPIIVHQVSPGFFNVLDGSRRILSAMQAKVAAVPGLEIVDEPRVPVSQEPHVFTGAKVKKLHLRKDEYTVCAKCVKPYLRGATRCPYCGENARTTTSSANLQVVGMLTGKGDSAHRTMQELVPSMFKAAPTQKFMMRGAAFRHSKTGQVIFAGLFHDPGALPPGEDTNPDWVDGFVDHAGKFYDRHEAAKAVGSDDWHGLESFQYGRGVREGIFKAESFMKGPAFRHVTTGQVVETPGIHNYSTLAEAISKPVEDIEKWSADWEAGFVGQDGKFYNRKEALKTVGSPWEGSFGLSTEGYSAGKVLGFYKSETREKPPKLPHHIQAAMEAIQAPGVLTDELRRPQYRGNPNYLAGHCYVAAEALWHLIDGDRTGWVPHVARMGDDTHWWLVHRKTGHVLDPTADQFEGDVPYESGVAKGFLTTHPSKRAEVVIERARQLMAKPLAKVEDVPDAPEADPDIPHDELPSEYLGTLEHDGEEWYIKIPEEFGKVESRPASMKSRPAPGTGRMSLDEAHKKYDWFHLSYQVPDEEGTFLATPRVPRTVMSGEDVRRKRISVGPSIWHAVMGLRGANSVSENWEIRTPESLLREIRRDPRHVGEYSGIHVYGVNKPRGLVRPSHKQVPDAPKTGEGWLTRPTKLQWLGRLYQHPKTNKPFIVTPEGESIKKALGDLPHGELIQGEPGRASRWDYTTLLPEKTAREGYRVVLQQQPHGARGHVFFVRAFKGNKPIGEMNGSFNARNIDVFVSQVEQEHRRRGLGLAMYEALYSHGRRHWGAKTVSGDPHSSSAHGVHEKLSRKHGLDYRAEPNYPSEMYPTKEAWEKGPPDVPSVMAHEFDARFKSYLYSLEQQRPTNWSQAHRLPGSLHTEGYRLSVGHAPGIVIGTVHRGGSVVGRVERDEKGQVKETWYQEPREGLKDAAVSMLHDHASGKETRDEWDRVSRVPMAKSEHLDNLYARAVSHRKEGGARSSAWRHPTTGEMVVGKGFIHDLADLGDRPDADEFEAGFIIGDGSFMSRHMFDELVTYRALGGPTFLSIVPAGLDKSEEPLEKMALIHNNPRKPRAVWRVENENGQGPYRVGTGCGIPGTESRQCDPIDVFSSQEMNMLGSRDIYFGFDKPEHAKRWFGGEDGLAMLAAEGFHLRKVPAIKIWRSDDGYQVMFKPHLSDKPDLHRRRDVRHTLRQIQITKAESTLVQGSHVTQPHATYDHASQAKPKGQEHVGGKNLWVRQTEHPTNEGRTLMVQFSSDLLQGGRKRDASDEYYDKLYSNRGGYHRPADFWEVPQWSTHVANSMPNADHYTVRNLDEAAKFFRESGYKHVAFSALDVNKKHVLDLAAAAPSAHFVVGGYGDLSGFAGSANVTTYPSVKSFVESEGLQYQPGYDYRHFSGTKVVPRLTLSDGCLHRCTFCAVPKGIEEKPLEEVLQQADAQAQHLDAELIYLNDKTFGQAKNHALLPQLYQRIKAQNPNFKGFIVQTTAAQMRKLTPKFLREAGIRHVELGVESFNDPILRAHKKPSSEVLIEEAADKIREAGASLIPNIMVGLPGEDAETYGRTMNWLQSHRDVISHVNVYNLALYDESELGKKLRAINEADRDENQRVKSWHVDPAIHDSFAERLFRFGHEQLDRPMTKAEDLVDDSLLNAQEMNKAEVDPHPPFASVVVVQNQLGEVLWGQRRDGTWTVPGGHGERGEQPPDAALRELWEEAGLVPEVMYYMGAGNSPDGEMPVHVYHAVAHGEPTAANDPDRELAGFRWAESLLGPPEDIAQNQTHNPSVVFDIMGWKQPVAELAKGVRTKVRPWMGEAGAAIPRQAPQQSSYEVEETPEFKKWFSQGGVTHPKTGKPLRMYHGHRGPIEGSNIKTGKADYSSHNVAWFTDNPKMAEGYAGAGIPEAGIFEGGAIMPAYVRGKFFDYRTDGGRVARDFVEGPSGRINDRWHLLDHDCLTADYYGKLEDEIDPNVHEYGPEDFINHVKSGSWIALEEGPFVSFLKQRGYHGIITHEGGYTNYGVFDAGYSVKSPFAKRFKSPTHMMRSEEPLEKAGEGSPGFARWFGDSKVVDETGKPRQAYHGSTHAFKSFMHTRNNPENYYGRAHYFTSSSEDASANYASPMGSDLQSRVQQRAEEFTRGMEMERFGHKPPSEKEATAAARKELVGANSNVMPVYLSLKNPVLVKPGGGTTFQVEQDFDEGGNPVGPERGSGVDLYNAVHRVSSNYSLNPDKVWSDVLGENGGDSLLDGITAHEIEKRLREGGTNEDAVDPYTGEMHGSGDFIRELWREMGFDGAMLDAYAAFGPHKYPTWTSKGMPHLKPGTMHYAVFDPRAIKSATGNVGTFSRRTTDITKEEPAMSDDEPAMVGADASAELKKE